MTPQYSSVCPSSKSDTFRLSAAENKFAFLDTLPEIEEEILRYHGLLKSLPLSDPRRPTYLRQLAELRCLVHRKFHQKSDLDKAVTHLTEAVLLCQTPSRDIVSVFSHLAALLLQRFTCYGQPDDFKFSIKSYRFLRIKFPSLCESFDIPSHVDLSSSLFHALAYNLFSRSTPGDIVPDFEEMVALIPEFVTADTLTYHQKHAMKAFCGVASRLGFTATMFRREDTGTQNVGNRAIQVLRETTVLNPDLDISFALAICLAARFQTTLVMNDYDDAMAIAERAVATHSPGSNPTKMEKDAMILILMLLVSRLELSSRPDYLEEAIHRIRIFAPCLPDEFRTGFTEVLDLLTQRRFDYFGVTGNSDRIPPRANPHCKIRTTVTSEEQCQTGSQMAETVKEIVRHFSEVTIAIKDGEITDVETAVERSRKLLPLQQTSDQSSYSPAYSLRAVYQFTNLLFEAYQCTKRSDYIDEAITAFRDLRSMLAPGPNVSRIRFNAGYMLYRSLVVRLIARQKLSRTRSREDFEELMQLLPELANDGSKEVIDRVLVSFFWARLARLNMHPSVSIAYETAMSLMQETLVFCPTLQTQHLCLARVFKEGWRLPSDYASYQIEHGQVKKAIETLEQGRALIWSEMRGLRTSTDQLRAADPTLADKFAYMNKRLESVAMSVAQSDDDDLGRSETGTGPREHSIGYLVLTQQRLLEERNTLVTHIQSLPGFEHFLKPPSFDFLNSAASHGPVIIVNQSQAVFSSHIILLLKDSHPFILSTPSGFHDRANQLENELLRVRKEKGLDSKDYGLTLASVLTDLYELVGKPVIETLRKLQVPERSRVWWCPTGAFCSLPLHAMGPILSADSKEQYFSDLYIPSYTPSLCALIESRRGGSLSDASDNSKPSILLVAQPDTLPGAFGEITVIQTTKARATTLISAKATPETVIEGLRAHRFAHFVCHGLLETGKPFDASLELHKANLTLLAIVRSQLPAAEFALLSACHTAELTEGSAADEGLHLAAAMQYCGFRSVVGTMWAMADTDGEDLSKNFYKAIFADKADQIGVPYYERSARALQITVKKLRKKRGMTLERWVNFVHYGA